MKLTDAIMEANGDPSLVLTREAWDDDSLGITLEDALAEDWVLAEGEFVEDEDELVEDEGNSEEA